MKTLKQINAAKYARKEVIVNEYVARHGTYDRGTVAWNVALESNINADPVIIELDKQYREIKRDLEEKQFLKQYEI